MFVWTERNSHSHFKCVQWLLPKNSNSHNSQFTANDELLAVDQIIFHINVTTVSNMDIVMQLIHFQWSSNA